VKLMAAVGAIVGWMNWLGILVLTSLMEESRPSLSSPQGTRSQNVREYLADLMSLRSDTLRNSKSPQLDVHSDQASACPTP